MNLEALANTATEVMKLLTPLIEAADPGAAAVLNVAANIEAGIAALEPDAVALFKQIKSGQPITVAQMQAQMDPEYDAAAAQLDADIAKASGG